MLVWAILCFIYVLPSRLILVLYTELAQRKKHAASARFFIGRQQIKLLFEVFLIVHEKQRHMKRSPTDNRTQPATINNFVLAKRQDRVRRRRGLEAKLNPSSSEQSKKIYF